MFMVWLAGAKNSGWLLILFACRQAKANRGSDVSPRHNIQDAYHNENCYYLQRNVKSVIQARPRLVQIQQVARTDNANKCVMRQIVRMVRTTHFLGIDKAAGSEESTLKNLAQRASFGSVTKPILVNPALAASDITPATLR